MAEKTEKDEVVDAVKDPENPEFSEQPVHEEATWGDVARACCVHEPSEWAQIVLALVVICFFLYFFLLGLELLGSSAKVLGGCTAGAILGDDMNPIGGLMIGILATVLLQSSSTTTSIIISLVGADSIGTKIAIFMIMGANIGTSVTNTIVSMGHLGNGDELERAFAGATVHDMFNFLSVAILLPIEAITQYLYHLTKAMVSKPGEGDKWKGPLKKIVSPLGNVIIKANKDIIKKIATDGKECSDFYPVKCDFTNNSKVHYESCVKNSGTYEDQNGTEYEWEFKNKKLGLITCDKDTGKCPAFFQNGATQSDDQTAGGVVLFIALVMLIVCLIGLVTVLQKSLMGVSSKIIYKATNINGYVAIAIGCAITLLVQSSSITTSTLTPLVGMDIIKLEAMFPLTLGANIGTTFTGLLAAMVSGKEDSLQVALAHLFFNISGILIWYPFPMLRRIPMTAARQLGKATRAYKLFPIIYILVVFFIFPLIILGISLLFQDDSSSLKVLGSFIVIIVAILIALIFYKWNYSGGKEEFLSMVDKRKKRSEAIMELPERLSAIESDLSRMKEHTGFPDEQ